MVASSAASRTRSRPQNRATVATVTSSAVGSEASAGDDEVDALTGEEAQLRLDVGGPVAADGDVGELDAQLQQPVGEPRTVAVLDASGEHFGSGDDDARAGAHGV